MNGFFGSGWDDPIEGLPQTPFQSPIVDPAQETFQFPFQAPSQDPSGGEGGQYAPVDVPENMLQEAYDPFQAFSDLNQGDASDWSDRFNPTASLVSNLVEIGKGMAQEQGFDLGVFGELNLSQSLLSNAWRASQWMKDNPEIAWDWAGDFPSLFEDNPLSNFASAVGESVQGFAENLSNNLGFGAPPELASLEESDVNIDAFSDWLASAVAGETPTEIQESGAAFGVDEIATGAMGESSLAAAESPVVAQTQTMAATGADLLATQSATGTAETMGMDVAPSVGDLLDLAAELIL